jgi:endogenous inhibitor of DNA gyrase (YacG/DUF329 family)
MGSYSCPTCGEEVEPVGWKEAGEAPSADGDAVGEEEPARDPGDAAHETRSCPGCGVRLARTPPGHWYTTG